MPRQFVSVYVSVKRLIVSLSPRTVPHRFPSILYSLLLNSVAYDQVYFTATITAEFNAGNVTPAKNTENQKNSTSPGFHTTSDCEPRPVKFHKSRPN